MRDVPEFQPKISLESGMRQVIDSMDLKNQIPNSDNTNYWEDQIIKSQKKVRITFSAKVRKVLFKIRKKTKKLKRL
tara:strand:- start:240 stop:467 length:228 start_codon:yes stop_codon:yes gene_type:complete